MSEITQGEFLKALEGFYLWERESMDANAFVHPFIEGATVYDMNRCPKCGRRTESKRDQPRPAVKGEVFYHYVLSAGFCPTSASLPPQECTEGMMVIQEYYLCTKCGYKNLGYLRDC